jgi:hypothetical protein
MASPHWLPSSEAEGTIAGPFGQKNRDQPGRPVTELI